MNIQNFAFAEKASNKGFVNFDRHQGKLLAQRSDYNLSIHHLLL